MANGTMYSISDGGGTGGFAPSKSARGLPAGTPLTITAVKPVKSAFQRVNERTGNKEDVYQFLFEYAAGTDGTTVAFTKKDKNGATVKVPAEAFKKGDRFVDYRGGVYLNNGTYKLGRNGGAAQLLSALLDLGAEKPADLEGWVGTQFTADRVRVSGPQGLSWTIMPKEYLGRVKAPEWNEDDVPEPLPEPTQARKPVTKAPPVITTGKVTAKKTAFQALSQEDQDTVLEALVENPDLTPQELVDAGIGADEAAAQAILDSAPEVA